MLVVEIDRAFIMRRDVLANGDIARGHSGGIDTVLRSTLFFGPTTFWGARARRETNCERGEERPCRG